MTVLIIYTQSRLRVLGASKRQAFPSPGLFVHRPFGPFTGLLDVLRKESKKVNTMGFQPTNGIMRSADPNKQHTNILYFSAVYCRYFSV